MLTKSIRRVLLAQVILGVVLVAVVWVVDSLGLGRAGAVAFGAVLGMLATMVTARSVIQSSRAAETSHFALLPLYSGLLFKLVLVAGGVFVGLVYLGLMPLYVLLGYITLQAGYFWAGTESPTTDSSDDGPNRLAD